MAGVAFITCKKYVGGSEQDAFYIGSVQSDGYTYFNDETMYRMRNDKTGVQLFYMPKQVWINTNVLSNINALDFDISGILNNVGNLLGGSGAANPNASVENAVNWLIAKAEPRNVTYSQAAGTGYGTRNLLNVNGLSYDCSSFVITGFWQAGFDVGGASYTGNMQSVFTAAGFKWIPGSYFPASQCIRGDILLCHANDPSRDHTQVYIGNNQDVNCGSTPADLCVHSPNNWSRGWTGLLRYEG